MVVEDEPAILRMVTFALRSLGYQAHAAPDAETALELLDSVRPDVIVADVRLPGMDGVELTRRVKSNGDLSSTPVVLMSAYGEPAQHEGDGFLPKPFDVDQLAAVIGPYVGS
ncbi:MAG: response regulator [Chloroflexi bacterium]|nr:response regulator [Chloroflexota bacterium]